MRRVAGLFLVLVTAVASGACAPMMGHPLYGGPAFGRPAPPLYPAQEPPVLGRWDRVMSLRSNFIIEVLDADGTSHTGRFIKADIRSLRLQANQDEVILRRADVIRVDLVGAVKEGETDSRDIAVGAARGAVTTAAAIALIPFLGSGKVWVPPARFWALGAVGGGIEAAQRNRADRRPRTVYIAPM